MSVLNISHVFGLRASRNPKNRQFSPIPKYGVSQGQWHRRTFEMSKCNASRQMWSASDLNQACPHCCQWQQVRLPKARSRWKILVWRHIFVAWPDPIIFFYQRLLEGCPISCAKFQCGPLGCSAVILRKHMGRVALPYFICGDQASLKSHPESFFPFLHRRKNAVKMEITFQYLNWALAVETYL